MPQRLLFQNHFTDLYQKAPEMLKTMPLKKVRLLSQPRSKCVHWTSGRIILLTFWSKVLANTLQANLLKVRKVLKKKNSWLEKSQRTHGSQDWNHWVMMTALEEKCQLGFWDHIIQKITKKIRKQVPSSILEPLWWSHCGGQGRTSFSITVEPWVCIVVMVTNLNSH